MKNKIVLIVLFFTSLILSSSFLQTITLEKKENTRYLSELISQDSLLPPPKGQTADIKAFKSDILVPKDYLAKKYQTAMITSQTGIDQQQTALFMIGKISVSIIFLESNGKIDPNTENWSPARIDDYTNRIKSGLNWLKSQQTNARIDYVYHVQTIQTSYEPITRSQLDEGLWVPEAMDYLGIPAGEYHDRVTQYNNNLRTADKTHWAYSIFVVDSYNDWDGMFANYIADYMAGPYIVMTYDNDGWGVFYTDVAAAHETAHEFGADDEYYPCHCDNVDGFLQVPNSNCVSGCPEGMCIAGEPECNGCAACYTSYCLMENLNTCLTISSRYQLGWRDKDNDGILDAIDSTYNSWTDTDKDGVVDYLDNCPNTYNPDQKDTNNNWVGDACEINNPPSTPIKPVGQASGNTGISYTYTTSAKDPNGDAITYSWNWGDGKTSTSTKGLASHAWYFSGSYRVTVIARDEHGATSSPSPALYVTIGKPSCSCTTWEPTFTCCLNKNEKWIRTCNPRGCDIESKCEGYCFV